MMIHLEDVYKAYGQKLILNDIDLKVSTGEFCSVVGPSGCGKTTILKLILGQEFATSGILKIDGEDITSPSPQQGIVYQRYSLFPHLTVLENIALGKRLERLFLNSFTTSKKDKEEAQYYLEKVRLDGHGNKYPHELSGGMQQRVAIAQALIMRPKVMLFDEPFGALDPGTREDLQVFLLELWEETRMTIFFVTHDLEEALFLGTRLLVISQFYKHVKNPEGAKIVADYPLSRSANSTTVKEKGEFGAMIQKIRREGFDQNYCQRIEDFNLQHKDSFQTI